MASTSKRDTLRPRNVQKSYRYACGAEAPLSTRLRERTKTTKTSRGKKAVKLTNTESLFYTTSGARLPSGVISGVIFLLFISLMNYLVVQWMPRWWRDCNLYNLQHKFNLWFLHRLQTQGWYWSYWFRMPSLFLEERWVCTLCMFSS